MAAKKEILLNFCFCSTRKYVKNRIRCREKLPLCKLRHMHVKLLFAKHQSQHQLVLLHMERRPTVFHKLFDEQSQKTKLLIPKCLGNSNDSNTVFSVQSFTLKLSVIRLKAILLIFTNDHNLLNYIVRHILQ